MKLADVQARINEALKILFARDSLLLEFDAGERAIAAKLACYMAPLFPDHDVDVEYNRRGLESKTVELPRECRGGGEKLIIPDIIVHRRGVDTKNLLVAEIKKETNPEPRSCDRAKILAMKKQRGYRWGVFIELPSGSGAQYRKAKEEWF